jgi:hypothetical protein
LHYVVRKLPLKLPAWRTPERRWRQAGNNGKWLLAPKRMKETGE